MSHHVISEHRENRERAYRAAPASPGTAMPQCLPLVQMQARWTLRAHRSYLHAANFHWQR